MHSPTIHNFCDEISSLSRGPCEEATLPQYPRPKLTTENFQQFVTRNRHKAFWMAFDLVGNDADAEELLQDAFLQAYSKWDTYEGRANIDAWFRRIVVNLCINHRNRRRVWHRIEYSLRRWAGLSQQTGFFPQGVADPETQMAQATLQRQIKQAADRLPEGQRTAFLLRFFHDFSIAEIAQSTKRAEGTIKSHLFRAMKTMKPILVTLQQNGEVQ